MKAGRIGALALLALTLSTSVAWAKSHTAIDRKHDRREDRIERVTQRRHAHTPWWAVGTHLRISLEAWKAKRANDRAAALAHRTVQTRPQRRHARPAPRGRRQDPPGSWGERFGRWKVEHGIGLGRWH